MYEYIIINTILYLMVVIYLYIIHYELDMNYNAYFLSYAYTIWVNHWV